MMKNCLLCGGAYYDNTAATNLDFWCFNPSTEEDFHLRGKDIDLGEWQVWKHCPSNKYIVGFRSQIEPNYLYTVDDTALNNVDFACY